MKPIKFLPIVMIAAAGLVASCSTPKLAQKTVNDDVYNSVAKAKEVEYMAPVQTQQAQGQGQNQAEYDEYYGTSNPYYDMDYSSRINRFYNGYSWRGYYDPYFDNYYYNNNYLGYGLGWNNGYGLNWGGGYYGSIWNNPFYYGNFGYGWNSPFYGWNSWGPNSYYDRFGWGGGFYGGGGYYGGGGFYGGGVATNRTYRARPGSNDTGVPRGSNTFSPNYGRPGRSSTVGGNNGAISSSNPNGRPSRNVQPNNQPSRPQPQMSRPSREERPAPSYSPPPSNGGSNGGGGSSGGGGGARPGRAGRG